MRIQSTTCLFLWGIILLVLFSSPFFFSYQKRLDTAFRPDLIVCIDIMESPTESLYQDYPVCIQGIVTLALGFLIKKITIAHFLSFCLFLVLVLHIAILFMSYRLLKKYLLHTLFPYFCVMYFFFTYRETLSFQPALLQLLFMVSAALVLLVCTSSWRFLFAGILLALSLHSKSTALFPIMGIFGYYLYTAFSTFFTSKKYELLLGRVYPLILMAVPVILISFLLSLIYPHYYFYNFSGHLALDDYTFFQSLLVLFNPLLHLDLAISYLLTGTLIILGLYRFRDFFSFAASGLLILPLFMFWRIGTDAGPQVLINTYNTSMILFFCFLILKFYSVTKSRAGKHWIIFMVFVLSFFSLTDEPFLSQSLFFPATHVTQDMQSLVGGGITLLQPSMGQIYVSDPKLLQLYDFPPYPYTLIPYHFDNVPPGTLRRFTHSEIIPRADNPLYWQHWRRHRYNFIEQQSLQQLSLNHTSATYVYGPEMFDSFLYPEMMRVHANDSYLLLIPSLEDIGYTSTFFSSVVFTNLSSFTTFSNDIYLYYLQHFMQICSLDRYVANNIVRQVLYAQYSEFDLYCDKGGSMLDYLVEHNELRNTYSLLLFFMIILLLLILIFCYTLSWPQRIFAIGILMFTLLVIYLQATSFVDFIASEPLVIHKNASQDIPQWFHYVGVDGNCSYSNITTLLPLTAFLDSSSGNTAQQRRIFNYIIYETVFDVVDTWEPSPVECINLFATRYKNSSQSAHAFSFLCPVTGEYWSLAFEDIQYTYPTSEALMALTHQCREASEEIIRSRDDH